MDGGKGGPRTIDGEVCAQRNRTAGPLGHVTCNVSSPRASALRAQQGCWKLSWRGPSLRVCPEASGSWHHLRFLSTPVPPADADGDRPADVRQLGLVPGNKKRAWRGPTFWPPETPDHTPEALPLSSLGSGHWLTHLLSSFGAWSPPCLRPQPQEAQRREDAAW